MSTRIETDPRGNVTLVIVKHDGKTVARFYVRTDGPPNPVVAAAEQVELAAEWSES